MKPALEMGALEMGAARFYPPTLSAFELKRKSQYSEEESTAQPETSRRRRLYSTIIP